MKTSVLPLRNRAILLAVLNLQTVAVIFYTLATSLLAYSFIGDEYAFYDLAKAIARGDIVANVFSADGVYSEFAIMGSYYQGMIMRLFGISIYTWKFSSILVIFPLGIFAFYTVRNVLGTAEAWLALILTDTSFYFHHFFQIGYVNNLSLVCLSAILFWLFASWPLQLKEQREYVYYAVLGTLCGLSWYFYIGKLFPVWIAIFLLITLWKQANKWKILATFCAPVVALVMLNIMCTKSGPGQMGLTKTVFNREYSDTLQFFKNLAYGLVLQLWTPSQTHYLPVAAYMDRISGVAAILGMALLVLQTLKRKIEKKAHEHMLLLFAGLCLIVGATSVYAYPPATRGIHYVPFYVFFACYTFWWIGQRLKKEKTRPPYFATVGIAVAALNIHLITRPLPLNPTSQMLADLAALPPARVLINNDCEFNLAVLQTLHDGYRLGHTLTVSSDPLAGAGSRQFDYVLSCTQPPDPASPLKTYESDIKLYRIGAV